MKLISEKREALLFSHVIAVTNRRLCSRPLTEQVEKICRLHPQALLLREKDLSESEYNLLAQDILNICKRYEVPCILHTYLQTAEQLNCPFIHLPFPVFMECNGKSDHLILESPENPYGSFREISGKTGQFLRAGTSVHSVDEAVKAQQAGALWLIAGHIYATDCKKGLPPRGTDFLRAVCQAVSIPVYAIGGIRPEETQLQEVMDCGAAGGCIMSGMMKL